MLREDLQDLLDRFLRGTDAVGDADTAVGVAGQGEAGKLLAEALDAPQAVKVSDAVLRHGRLPQVDTGKQRRSSQTENLLQFVAHDADDLVFAEGPQILRISSGKKTSQ